MPNRYQNDLTVSGILLAQGPIVRMSPATLAFGATVNTDANLGDSFRVLVTGNFTLANPTNAHEDQHITWRFNVAAAGVVMSTGNLFRFGTDISGATLSQTSGKIDYLGAVYNSDVVNSGWHVVAFSRGY